MPHTPQRAPSLQQLRIFEAVADRKSISAAAETIRLSQPSVSLAIRRLEETIGGVLLDRRNSGCYLTRAGTILLARVERTLAQIRQSLYAPAVGSPFVAQGNVRQLESKITDPQIRSLIAVSESISFDQAARRIGVTEPTLHRAARTLERVLHRPLYRRTAQGYTTTPTGKELARRFKLAAREIDYAMDEIAAERGHFKSRVVVGNIPHSDPHFLSVAINQLLSRFPDISVEVVDGHYVDLLDALRHGSVDLLYGVLRRRKQRSILRSTFYFRIAMRLLHATITRIRKSKKYWRQGSGAIRLDHAAAGTPRRQAFEQIFRNQKSKPRVSIETTSIGLQRAVLTGSDRLSLFAHREVVEDAGTGFKTVEFRSHKLQRNDEIAIRRDWKPTRLHVEFVEGLRALAAGARLPDKVRIIGGGRASDPEDRDRRIVREPSIAN